MEIKTKNNLLEEAEELIAKLRDFKGRSRGVSILNTLAYIEKKEGKGALVSIDEELEKLGYPMKIGSINPNEWYPAIIDPLIMIIVKNIFSWKEKDFYDAGYFSPQVSTIPRLLLRYMVSPVSFFESASRYWGKYYDFGKIEKVSINEKEKYFILRLRDFDLHPFLCIFLSGYLARLVSFMVGKKSVRVEEKKCLHKNDPYHEYKIEWE